MIREGFSSRLEGSLYNFKKVHSTYFFQNTQYTVGDPAFEFVVRPHENKKVTFESRKFVKSFISVDQNAAVSVREMPPDSSEVQFAVRVQVRMSMHMSTKVHDMQNISVNSDSCIILKYYRQVLL